MSLFRTLKRNSKHALSHNWGRAIAILLLVIGISLLFGLFMGAATLAVNGGVPPSNPTMEQLDLLKAYSPQFLGAQLIMALFSVFLLTPLTLGVLSWYLSVAKGAPEPFGGIFTFYEKARRYGRSVLYSLNMGVRTFLWALAFFTLPSCVLGAVILFTQQYSNGGDRRFAIFSALGMVLACFLMLLAILLYAAYMNKYYLTGYLLAYDDTLTVRAAIRKSALLTAEHRFSLLWYQLSFLGWLLLAALFFPLLFYVIPYMRASFAMYGLYLIEKPSATAPPDDHTREFSRAQQEDLLAETPEQAAASDPTVQISREEVLSQTAPDTAPWEAPAPPEPEAPVRESYYASSPEPYAPSPEQTEQKPADPGKWPYV